MNLRGGVLARGTFLRGFPVNARQSWVTANYAKYAKNKCYFDRIETPNRMPCLSALGQSYLGARNNTQNVCGVLVGFVLIVRGQTI
jgi:hypothetical protein